MQKEYKEEMQKISLSADDKARILANVKREYEKSANGIPAMSGPRFSIRRIGMAAAAFAVIAAVSLLVKNQFFDGERTGSTGTPVAITDKEEEVWEELGSVDDIARETDCRTYTLSNVSKSYKVKKVEVAKKQKHVKIMYKSKKDRDKILLEYKEEKDAEAVTGQFAEKKELKKEKVGEKEVTMYGDKECDGMTWQEESCTFAVTMSRGCSTVKAAKLASGTKETKPAPDGPADDIGKEPDDPVSRNAVGWEGGETESSSKQRRSVLDKIYEMAGFRVIIEEPAQKAAYKIVDEFESFGFLYPEIEELQGQRIVGYAGREGRPDGITDGFTAGETISVNGIPVQIYQDEEGEEIYTFTKQEIEFTLLVGDTLPEDRSRMLSGLMSVMRISLESGQSDETQTDEENGQSSEENDPQQENMAALYRETAQEIQYAAVDGDLKELSSYIQFPLTIRGLDMTIASAKEFQGLDPSLIFSSEWVDSVAAYDTGKIGTGTRTFTMGDGDNYLICQIKNDTVVITDISIEKKPEEPTPSSGEE